MAHGRPELRLTRRGRLAVTAALLLLALVGMALFSEWSAATGARGEPGVTQTIVVERGDTLWEIAASVDAPGDLRETVHLIEKLNALPGAALVEGQELAVPVG